MLSRRLVLLLLGSTALAGPMTVLACVGDDAATSPTPATDAAVESASSADAADATPIDAAKPRCDRAKAFGPPRKILGVSTGNADDSSPFLSRDGQALYFASTRASASYDLFVATRVDADTFSGVTPVAGGINMPGGSYEASPFLTDGELTMYFARGPLFGVQLHVATRPTAGAQFGPAGPLTAVNSGSGFVEDTPFVTKNGESLYFTSNRDGQYRLYRAQKTAANEFGNALKVAELVEPATAVNQGPTLTDDELTIYWTSSRTTGGAYRIYEANRGTTAASFEQIRLVQELAVGLASYAGHVSGDGCTMVFASAPEVDANQKVELLIADKPPVP